MSSNHEQMESWANVGILIGTRLYWERNRILHCPPIPFYKGDWLHVVGRTDQYLCLTFNHEPRGGLHLACGRGSAAREGARVLFVRVADQQHGVVAFVDHLWRRRGFDYYSHKTSSPQPQHKQLRISSIGHASNKVSLKSDFGAA